MAPPLLFCYAFTLAYYVSLHQHHCTWTHFFLNQALSDNVSSD